MSKHKAEAAETEQVTDQENMQPTDETEVTTAEVEESVADEALDPNSLQSELNEAQTTIGNLNDQMLRLQAELENIRRRAQRDVENAHKYGLDKFAAELLPVIDSLEMGLQAMSDVELDESAHKLYEGTEMTLKLLTAATAKFGILPVGSAGDSFNPELHQAISMQPSDEYPANTISVVMQKGYTLNGRLVRPAMVVVSQ